MRLAFPADSSSLGMSGRSPRQQMSVKAVNGLAGMPGACP